MIVDFIALKKETTAKEAIKTLQREYADIEMPFYLYVVSDYGHLLGVLSLRQLVVVLPATQLKSIMDTDAVSVQTNTDQEEVSKIVIHYNMLAVPVVDENNIQVGIVTIDDGIDIIHVEATEDMLKMSGVSGSLEYTENQTVFKSIRKHLPWLLANWIGGAIVCYVVGYSKQSLNKLIYLAAFMPIIMGMGGNVGTQTSASIMRELATGRININQIGSILSSENSLSGSVSVLYGV